MLAIDDLKTWLHRDLPRLDKLLLVLGTLDGPCMVNQINDRALLGGLRLPKNWNVSSILSGSGGLAIRTPLGWELADSGKLHLRTLGIGSLSPAAMQVAVDLREHLQKIADEQTREFVQEAISCHEATLYRSAIVMSWLGAMDVLHHHVFDHHLSAFNTEAFKVFGKKWKVAKTTDDLGKMAEGEFLDRLAALSIIGKNVKTDLKTCLDRRNGCGHPNSLKVSANQSAAHIETLLLNVFQRFP